MHESVLLQEVSEFLRPNREDGTLVDATVGLGGHSLALLERYPAARLLAIDRDPQKEFDKQNDPHSVEGWSTREFLHAA